MIDWARCLRCVIERCESCGLKMDWQTCSIFLSGIRKHLRYLQNAPDAPRDLSDDLSNYVGQIPYVCLAAIETWLRLIEQFRFPAPANPAGCLPIKPVLCRRISVDDFSNWAFSLDLRFQHFSFNILFICAG